MTDLHRDFRHGVRLLATAPGFAVVAVLVLALGIGANVGIFSLVNTLILQPRPGRIDSLVGVFSRDATKPDSYRNFSYPAYVDLRARTDVFDALMAHTFSTVGVRDGDITKQAFATFVSANYFQTLGVTLAAGRTFTVDDERRAPDVPVAIASYAMWSRRGFDPGFLGSTVRINGTGFTIVGVTPKGFAGVMAFASPQWWLPLGIYDKLANEMFRESAFGLDDRRTYALNLAGALKPGLSPDAAQQALAAVARQLGDEYSATDRDRTFVIAPLPRVAISSKPQTDGPLAAVSALLVLMAGLVLAVACLNVATLLLARGVARRREVAIRQALGGGRWRIVRQLLVEGLTLSVIGGAFGLVLGWWASSAVTAWLAGAITFGIDLVVVPTPRLIGAAVAFALISTVLFALGPAWSLSRPDLTADLKGEPVRVGRRLRTGSLLVIGQLAASLALVVAGGLFTRGALNAAVIEPGYAIEHQLVVGVDPSLAGYKPDRTKALYRTVLGRLRALPGVERASFASTVAFGDITMGGTVRQRPTDTGVSALFDIVGTDYFETLGARMLRGREFTPEEEQAQTGPPVAIINGRLAKQLFGDADPIGRSVQLQVRQAESPQTYTIVGVAPVLRHDLFEEPPPAHLYVPYGERFNTIMTLHVRTASGTSDAAMLSTVRRALLEVDPQLPILTARTMAMHRDASISAWSVRAAATVFTAFGVLALLLAAIGVYGLKSYDTGRRTREIGIRMALGATAGDVQRLIVQEGSRATIVGIAAGIALALAVGKLASGLLFRVSPFDPLILGAAAGALTTTALLAGYIPARRATRVAPLDALRTE